MPGASRVGDCAKCPIDAHGCKACSHNVSGPVTQGSQDVIINGKPAARTGDSGIHGMCCGLNRFSIMGGAPNTFINGMPAARQTDTTIHCGGIGDLKQGSSNVIIGNGMGKLMVSAAKSHAPFVANLNATDDSSQKIIQQNIDYLEEKGFSGNLSNKLPEENFVQRTKHRLKEYIDERGAQNYAEGHKAAAFIDAVGSTMLDDVPETSGAAAANIGISLIFGAALKVIGKGARKLLMNLDKISEPLQSKIKSIFKKADAGKKLTDTDRKVIAEALDEIDGKAATNSDDFVGKLKGEPVVLPKVKMQKISYAKRSQEELVELRKQFDSTEKKKFLKDLANDPDSVVQLREAGLSEKDIAKMKNGLNPNKEWQVHHKLPLDDGGTNDMDNLVLIKNDPYHKTITNAQNVLVKDLNPGETKVIDWPIPEGSIYPLGK